MSADNGQLSVVDLIQMWAEADRLRGADSRMVMPRDPDWLNTRERMIREAVGGTPEAPEDGDGEDDLRSLDLLIAESSGRKDHVNGVSLAFLRRLAARLRSHTREEPEGWVERRCNYCNCLWSKRPKKCHSSPYVDDSHNFQTRYEQNTPSAVHPLTQGEVR